MRSQCWIKEHRQPGTGLCGSGRGESAYQSADGDDTEAMLTCLQLLGIGVSGETASTLTRIGGTGGVLAPGPIELPAGSPLASHHHSAAALGPGPE
jgi:hypothetical protein